ncbi:hypothetical protein PV10_07563 [Exophiala mesophila]|uniref:Uncharacterized protein n=1 Tax=Exophiala mesophila TaxID=212818 RepID=A0A0D1Z870_EXOME|nr:uncharacterized protein PV10_07563 [Exophiala mesophila]KIV90234.1 hypothetical protein PV10_07563 [Exophiala mesophila]
MDGEEVYVEDYTHTGCYIFQPATSQPIGEEEHDEVERRPRKKRRTTNDEATISSTPQDGYTWLPLLNGQEHSSSIDLRRQTFHTIWTRYQSKIDDIVNRLDEQFVTQVLDYVNGDPARRGRLKTGLIVSGTTKNAQRDLSLGWNNAPQSSQDKDSNADLLVQLHPNASPNLQTALKNVIKLAISQHGGVEEYTNFLTRQKALIPMNFDLELLQRYVKKHKISRVVVSIQDVETFDTGVISELISTLHSWSGRIPFILLIDISTTVELFESRLSRSTWSLLDAQVFELTRNKLDPLLEPYRIFQYDDDDADVFLGPGALNVLSELAEDQSTSIEGFVRAIKYLMMTHFFANAVSVLAAKPITRLDPVENKNICQAIRNMPEFQQRCDSLLKDRSKIQKVRDLIVADELLLEDSIQTVRANQAELKALLKGVHILHTIHDLLPLPPVPPLKLESDLLSRLPNLLQSDIYLDIEDALKSLDREEYRDFVDALIVATEGTEFSNFEAIADGKEQDEDENSTPAIPLPLKQLSSSDDHEDDINTTNSPSTSPTHFISLLQAYISHTSRNSSQNPWTTYLSTASTINGRNPLSSIIHAAPRFALERALTRPADYLSCVCCSTTTRTASIPSRSDLPTTSLLLTLLNEAGNVVNVRDLWDAFRESLCLSRTGSRSGSGLASARIKKRYINGGDKQGVVEDGDEEADDDNDDDDDDISGDGDEDDESKERQTLALFYRGLAELRHLGFVKPSKRKPGVDCIARTVWMGL